MQDNWDKESVESEIEEDTTYTERIEETEYGNFNIVLDVEIYHTDKELD